MVLLLVEDLLHLLPLFIQIHKVAQVKVKENMHGVEDMGYNLAVEGNKLQLNGHILTIMAVLMNHFSQFNPICHHYLFIPAVVTDPQIMLILKVHPPSMPNQRYQPSRHEGSNVDFMKWLHHY